jgi:MoaA/NifB/PqqE/SkfB family radical SAM enzyme
MTKSIEYIFNKEKKTLLKLKGLQEVNLNETAVIFLDQYLQCSNENETHGLLSNKFRIKQEIIKEDFDDFLSGLKSENFVISRSNTAYKNEIQSLNADFGYYQKISTPICHIIQNCNSPCRVCDCWTTKGRVFHPLNVLERLFIKLKDIKVKSIMISGGEPLMHPDIEDIIDLLNQLKIDIELNTNGLLLNKHPWLTKKDLMDIVVSIDGITKNDYYEIRGVNKLDKVISNVQHIKKINPNQSIGSRITLTKYTLLNIQDSIEFMIESGFNYIGFSPLDFSSTSFSRDGMDNKKSAGIRNSFLPTDIELLELLKDFEDSGSKMYKYITQQYNNNVIGWNCGNFLACIRYYLNKFNSHIKSNDHCSFPYTSMLIDYDGSVKNCFYSDSIGNIYDFDQIKWSSSEGLIGLKSNNTCSGCRGKVFCG